MPRGVHDHLLTLERRIEVRHDPDGPPRSVRLARISPERERLRRRERLAPLAEGAAFELLRGRTLERAEEGSGPSRTTCCDDNGPT
jgi:hypothetical protein